MDPDGCKVACLLLGVLPSALLLFSLLLSQLLLPPLLASFLRSSSSWCLLSIHLAFGKPPLLHFWAAAYDDSASMDHHWNPSHHYHHHAWAFGGGETSPVVYDSSHPHFLVRSMIPINECAIISSLFLLHSELLLLPYHPSHLVAFTIWISRLFLFVFKGLWGSFFKATTTIGMAVSLFSVMVVVRVGFH